MAEKERDKDRNALLRLERELDRIFSSMGHGMYVVDNDRRILLWNRAAESILGWTEEDALGKDCKEFIGHTDEEGNQLCDTECPLTATMDESRTVFAGTVWAHRKDGSDVPVNVSCAPLYDDEGVMVGAVEVFSDMTREKEIDRMKSEMCSVVAHQFRTPLTSMSGYLELILDGDTGDVTDEQKEFLNIVQSGVVELRELVNEFLDLDRLESGRTTIHWEKLPVHSLIDEVLSTHIPEAESKEIEIALEKGEVPDIHGDRTLLKQALSNLVSNAIKYTNRGRIGVRTAAAGDEAVIQVWDTGVGIPPSELKRLGERFFRATTAEKTGAPGSGLGLAIVREIVDSHGGRLEIESTPDVGSTFSVILPRSEVRVILDETKELDDA